MEKTKLTDDEVKVFTETSNTIKSITVELGNLELTFINLKSQLDNVVARKEDLIKFYNETLQKQREHNQELLDKYGAGNLNTDTWEFTPISE
jgi:hypothetical protein